MIDNISRHPLLKFIVPTALWFFAIGMIRYLHRPYGLDFDGAEQTYLSQWFELGSGIQPPLPTWIFHIVFDVFGHSVAWVNGIRLFMIFLVYVGFYKLSLKLIKNEKLALMSTLSLVFIFQFSSVMLQQMHTVFITLAVIWSWLCIVNIYENGKLKSFIWLGFWLGFGFLSKYNFFIHVAALLLALLMIQDIRKQIFQPKIMITILIAILICSPHYIWLLENLADVGGSVNNDLTVGPETSRIQDLVKGLSELVLKVLAFGAPLIIAFLIFFFSVLKSKLMRIEPLLFKMVGNYMVISAIILVAVMLITRATMFREHWLQPFFLIFPILLFQKLKESELTLSKRFRLFKAVCLVLFLLISIDFSLKSYVKLYTGHPASVFNIPYKNIADHLMEYEPACDLIFTNDATTAGHLKMILPDKLVLVDKDHDHLTLERLNILNAVNPVFVYHPEKDEEQVPFDETILQNDVDPNIYVNIIDPKFESFNYDFTDKRTYRVGIAKILLER